MTKHPRVPRRWRSTARRASTRCSCAAPAAKRATCRTRRCARRASPSTASIPSRRGRSSAQMREGELAASAAVIGFDEVEMLGYRDSGMPDTEPNQHPDSLPPGRHRRGDRPAGGDHPAHPPAGDHHLRRRPVGLSAPRSPARPRHLGAGVRTGGRSRLVSRSSASRSRRRSSTTRSGRRQRIVAVHEAILARTGESPFSDEWLDRPSQDHRITTKVDVGDYLWARDRVVAGPRHPGRPDRRVVVRRSTTRPWPASTRGRTGSSPGRSSGRSRVSTRSATCSPACRERVTQ